MHRLEAIAQAHDALAPAYDMAMAANPVAEWMRQQLWAHYARVFPADGRLLDLAAGTGADSLWLAQRGANVTAIDVSAGMLAQLQHSAAERRLQIETRVLSLEALETLEALDQLEAGQFAGALSGFAGLNTVDELELPRFSANLARLVRPGSHVVLHVLNAFCLWETLNHLLHGRRPRPRQQLTDIGGVLVRHRFYEPVRLYRQVFARQFALSELYALSVIAAPTWVRRVPRLAPLVLRVDRAVGTRLRGAGDFFVMDLVAK